eukprot:INCI4371.1.p1 GENE.INCI4371.1~~INCI4371.1.p1  ORF type:complete len:1120 (+),score=155.92 INCI4371.1:334-3693(+)
MSSIEVRPSLLGPQASQGSTSPDTSPLVARSRTVDLDTSLLRSTASTSSTSSASASRTEAWSGEPAAEQGADEGEEEELLRVIRKAIDESDDAMVSVSHLSSLLQWSAKHRRRRGKLLSFLKKRGFVPLTNPANRNNVAVTYSGSAVVNTAKLASKIVVVHTTREYKAMARRFVTKDDVVLEVGCAEALTTKIIAGLAKDVVGIDLSSKEIARAKARFPELELHVMDGLDYVSMRKLRPNFTKVFLDVSGTRALANLLPVIDCVEKKLRPDLIVVKSVYLNQLKEKIVAGSDLVRATDGGVAAKTASAAIETAVPDGQFACDEEDREAVIAHLVAKVQALESKHTDLASFVGHSPTNSSGVEEGSDDHEDIDPVLFATQHDDAVESSPRRVSFPAVSHNTTPPPKRSTPRSAYVTPLPALEDDEPLPGSLQSSPTGLVAPYAISAPRSRTRAYVYALDPKFRPLYYPMPPMNVNARKAIRASLGVVERVKNTIRGTSDDESLLPTALQAQRTCLDLQATIAPNSQFVAVVTPRIIEISKLPSSTSAPTRGPRLPAGFASVSLDRLRASLGLALLEEYSNRPGHPPHVSQLTKLAVADGRFPFFAPLLCEWNAASNVFAYAQGPFVYAILLDVERTTGAPLTDGFAQVRVLLLPEGDVCVGLSVLARTPAGRLSIAVCLRSGITGVAVSTAAPFSKTFEIRENGIRGGVADATAAAPVAAYSYVATQDEDVVFGDDFSPNGSPENSPNPRFERARRRSSIGSHKISRLHVQWRTARLPDNGLSRIDFASLALAPADGAMYDDDDSEEEFDEGAEVLVVAAGGPVAKPSRAEVQRRELSAIAVVAVRGLHAGSSASFVETQYVLGFASSEESLKKLHKNTGSLSSLLGTFSGRFRALPPGLAPLTRVSFSPCGRYLLACDLMGDVTLWRMLASGLAPARVYQASRVLDAFWTAGGSRLGVLQQPEPSARRASVRVFDLAPATSACSPSSSANTRGIDVDEETAQDEFEDHLEATGDKRVQFVEPLVTLQSPSASGVSIGPGEDGDKVVALPFESAFQVAHQSGANGADLDALDRMVLLEITPTSAVGTSDGESLGRRPSANDLLGPLVTAAVRLRLAKAVV